MELLRMGAANALAVHFVSQNQSSGLRAIHKPPVRYPENIYDFPLDMDDHQGFFNLSLRACGHLAIFFIHLEFNL